MEKAVAHARSGNGPYLLEMNTYRYKGHSMSDPAKYRTKEEVAQYKELDPIEQVRKVILKNKFASEEDLGKIEDKIKQAVTEAVKFAEESDYPKAEDAFEYVYMQEDYPFEKG